MSSRITTGHRLGRDEKDVKRARREVAIHGRHPILRTLSRIVSEFSVFWRSRFSVDNSSRLPQSRRSQSFADGQFARQQNEHLVMEIVERQQALRNSRPRGMARLRPLAPEPIQVERQAPRVRTKHVHWERRPDARRVRRVPVPEIEDVRGSRRG